MAANPFTGHTAAGRRPAQGGAAGAMNAMRLCGFASATGSFPPTATSAIAIRSDRFTSIVFSNGSRAGVSSGCRRFRVPAFSACSFGT